MKKKQLVNVLRKAAREEEVSLSLEEVLLNGVIGIDGIGRKLIYVDKRHSPFEFEIIDIQLLESCTIQTNFLPIRSGELEFRDMDDFVQQIYLRLVFDESAKIVDIPFYDCRFNSTSALQDARITAERCRKMISRLMQMPNEMVRA